MASQYPAKPHGYDQRPDVPYPWVAEFDSHQSRWFYVNRDTGERTWNYPRQGYGGGYGGPPQQGYDGPPQQGYGGPPPQGYGVPPAQSYGGPSQQGYGGGYQPRGEYYQEQSQKPNHTMRNVALTGVAGLAAGVFLDHEAHKVEERWDDDKYRAEADFRNVGSDIANAPDDAAQWAGRRVQDVEDIPQDFDNWKGRQEYRAEQGFDDAVDDVEDAPEEAAGAFGRAQGRVEGYYDDGRDDVDRFDDNVDAAYDEGRDEGRDDDNW